MLPAGTVGEIGVRTEANIAGFWGNPEATAENIREILRLCMRYETPVVVGTDAHHTSGVGQFGEALAALEDTGFPEELVANTSLEKYERLLEESRRA